MKITEKEVEKQTQEKRIEIRKEINFTLFSWHSISTHCEVGERKNIEDIASSDALKKLLKHFIASPSLVELLVSLYFYIFRRWGL